MPVALFYFEIFKKGANLWKGTLFPINQKYFDDLLVWFLLFLLCSSRKFQNYHPTDPVPPLFQGK